MGPDSQTTVRKLICGAPEPVTNVVAPVVIQLTVWQALFLN